VMSAVQARLHASMKQEFKILAEVVRFYMPPEYPYEVEDGATRIEDYANGVVDVIPVSDPNATTMAQRIMQYQAALQLAQNQPTIYDMPALHRRMIYTLGIKDADQIIPDKKEIKPADPISENMNILNGKPVKAFAYQNHEAHIAVHQAAMQDPQIQQLVGQSPNAATIQAATMAHLQEHIAFAYRKRIEMQLGVPLPAQDEALPEDVEAQLSPLLAQAAQRVLQQSQAQAAQQQAQQQAQDPVLQMQQKDIQIREMEVQRKMRKDETEAQIASAMLQRDAASEKEKMAVQERIAGLKAGVEVGRSKAADALRKEQITSTERTQGARLGVEIARDNRGRT